MQSYHRMHVQLVREDLRGRWPKGRESARVLRRKRCELFRRYKEEGLESALHEKPRPGKQRTLDVGQSERVIAMFCGSPPEGIARCSVRLVDRGGKAEAGAANGPGDDPHPASELRI